VVVSAPWAQTAVRIVALAFFAACSANPPARVTTAERLEGTDGALHAILPLDADAYTVVIFFSPDCHVLAAHDDRIRKLAADFAPPRVRIVAVDPEVDASLERDRAEIKRRRYPFPVLLDREGKLARFLGAAYAGYTVVLDRDGIVRYRGGIDSDRVRLRDDATPYLGNALSDLLAGRAPRVTESKALGCALRLR
jgi:thiol-disulfide isomerase/thioredoxin